MAIRENLKIYTTCSPAGVKSVQTDPYLSKRGVNAVWMGGENTIWTRNSSVIRIPVAEIEEDADKSYALLKGMWNGCLAIEDHVNDCYILRCIKDCEIREISKGVKDWLDITYPKQVQLYPFIPYKSFEYEKEESGYIDDLIKCLPTIGYTVLSDGWEVVIVYNGEKKYFRLVEVKER